MEHHRLIFVLIYEDFESHTQNRDDDPTLPVSPKPPKPDLQALRVSGRPGAVGVGRFPPEP